MRVNEKGYLCCPDCGSRTKTKIRPDTVLKRFPLYCSRCKKEYIISTKEPKSRN